MDEHSKPEDGAQALPPITVSIREIDPIHLQLFAKRRPARPSESAQAPEAPSKEKP